MQRRAFCKLLAIATASEAIPTFSHAARGNKLGLPNTFNEYFQDYAQFSALLPQLRVFYELSGGRIEQTELDNATWKLAASGRTSVIPVPGGSWDGVPLESAITDLVGEGPYKPTWDSLLQYDAPEWYQDAKCGIWAHWSPQCVPEAGDWYAHNMYIEGSRQYKCHIEHYGPPSKFGYKDQCSQWTLLNWEPDELISRYRKAGARIFVALANHHDSFDAWNSIHQPWNSSAIGPHRDVVGTWAAGARKQGLRFGVTVHQAFNWWWCRLHGYMPLRPRYPETSVGWYRLESEIPASDAGRRIWGEFDGVFRDSLIWVNDCFIGRNYDGYTPFRFDLYDYVHFGGWNCIVLCLDGPPKSISCLSRPSSMQPVLDNCVGWRVSCQQPQTLKSSNGNARVS